MTAQPNWSPVDEQTGSLLDLLADDGSAIPGPAEEWSLFLLALVTAMTCDGGMVRQNRVRPMVRDKVSPRRVGPFYRRACLEGLIVATGEWETSDDAAGKNAGRPMRCYRWTGGA